jgi:hypothetical protein
MPLTPFGIVLLLLLLLAWPALVAANAYVKRDDLPDDQRIRNAAKLGGAAALLGIVVFAVAAVILTLVLT